MAGLVGMLFRRDRLTGQVAVGLVGVLVIAAGVYGVGVASAKYRIADVGAWLTARGKGLAVHVNGPAARWTAGRPWSRRCAATTSRSSRTAPRC